jgi:Cu-Zn family superoxide dismutase
VTGHGRLPLALLCASSLCFLAGCPASSTTPLEQAIAVIEPRSPGSTVKGAAVFSEYNGQVTLQLYVQGAPPGVHAAHIHQNPDCSAADGLSAGPHWNPAGVVHGSLGAGHLGDIGNFEVGADGTGTLRLTSALWEVNGDVNKAVVGHAVVIHALPDDLVTDPAGAAGARVGCGVIVPLSSSAAIDPAGVRSVTASLQPRSASGVSGTAKLVQIGAEVTLELDVTGATPGNHGVHLHATGDCTAADGTSAGAHWNPGDKSHGDPSAAVHHLGDLGNVAVGADGVGKLVIKSSEWVVGLPTATTREPNDVVGKAVIFHAGADDLTSQPVGNAGGRAACGVIGDAVTPPSQAVATLLPRSNSLMGGTATFTQTDTSVSLQLNVNGLTPGQHGVHLHERGDCSAFDATSAGAHWNPEGAMHGLPTGASHLGDIGNLTVAADGTGTLTFPSTRWRLLGSAGVVGKALVVHGAPDDGVTQATGNSGARVGCGVVTLPGQQPADPVRLSVNLEAKSTTTTTAKLLAVQSGPGVTLKLDVAGGTPGLHGVHVHEVGDCSAADALTAGPHWNPLGQPHGLPDGGAAHIGDLGNVTVAADGTGSLVVSSLRWALADGGVADYPRTDDGGFANAYADGGLVKFDLIGRALVVHGGADDGTQPAGDAGARVSCGVIR